MSGRWQPMNTAPRDAKLVRLLIAADDARENPLDDSDQPTETVGFWQDDEGWLFAGWCWCHDRFTQGAGNPVAWAPLPELEPLA